MWRFFIFCGVIAFAGKPASSSCGIEMSSPRVVVRFGDPILVNCSTSSNQAEGMGWESTYGGTGLQEGVSYVPLSISSVKDWKIEPQCYVNLLNNKQCIEVLPVTVYKMPDSVTMTLRSPLDQVVEGQKYRVQCDIVNVAPVRNLSVHLYKGNKVLFTDSFTDSTLEPVNKSVTASIDAQRDDNGTQIWCEAELKFEPVGRNPPVMRSTPREVIVLYPPVFAAPERETLEISPGNKIILNCTAKGNPMPAYSWEFPNFTPQMNKDQNETEPILIPSSQHPGLYACTASNHLGKTTKYFTVEAKSSYPGTTAGIVMAVFIVVIFILGWDRTTFAALVGGFVALGVLIAIVGLLLLTPYGTFSCTKGSYLRGQPV